MVSPNKRIKTLSVTRPIVYGNTAKPFSDSVPKPDNCPEQHTHLWTAFLRLPPLKHNNNDLDKIVKKVVFKLHDTYPNPLRTVEGPGPFQLTETGWGEFEIQIKIFFQPESGEKPVTIYHHLQLHPYNGQPVDGEIRSVFYDELVFNEPTEAFFSMLTTKPGNMIPDNRSEGVVFSRQSELEEIERLEQAAEKIQEEIEALKAKLVV